MGSEELTGRKSLRLVGVPKFSFSYNSSHNLLHLQELLRA